MPEWLIGCSALRRLGLQVSDYTTFTASLLDIRQARALFAWVISAEQDMTPQPQILQEGVIVRRSGFFLGFFGYFTIPG